MKRAVLFLAMLAACADATGPREAPSTCYAYVVLIGNQGERFELWGSFDPCPSDAEFAANGWTRAPKPAWWVE